MDINSLSHTKWTCKYHIVFAPKYRRKVIYGQLYQDIAKILDHVHMLVEIPPSQSVSSFVGYFLPKSGVNIRK